MRQIVQKVKAITDAKMNWVMARHEFDELEETDLLLAGLSHCVCSRACFN